MPHGSYTWLAASRGGGSVDAAGARNRGALTPCRGATLFRAQVRTGWGSRWMNLQICLFANHVYYYRTRAYLNESSQGLDRAKRAV